MVARPSWYRDLVRSRAVSIAIGIGADVLLTFLLLLGLSAIDSHLDRSEASELFKVAFATTHVFFVLSAYVLIAVKGLFRIWRR